MDEEMADFFRRFGVPIPNMPRQQRPQQQPEDQPEGGDPGSFLTPDGLVMTNAHVVEGADEVIVTLTDKREFKAKIVGSDKRTDVALVKIDATGLPAVKVGDVSRLKAGEWVMAIGSPFGLENTVTAGIVSAKQRDTGTICHLSRQMLPSTLETQGATDQHAWRGGRHQQPDLFPLGRVHGNFIRHSDDEAMRVSDQLRTAGRVTRGRIGVQIGPVTKDVAESLGLGKAQGRL